MKEISIQKDVPTPDLPLVSVVIATRNRGSRILEALSSVLANDYPRFDVWIVDQSDNSATEQALQPLLKTDPRINYIKSSTRGCSVGRNIGIASSSGPIIAITDDDCTVAPDWLSRIEKAFATCTKIGIVNGTVVAGEHDRNAGFITVYLLDKPFLAQNITQKNQVRGITACMAIQRSAWIVAGKFDQMLGVGTPLRSASEGDFIIKALLKNYYVYETPEVKVTHNGFRNWKDYRKLSAQYSFGNGALFAKYLKLYPGFALAIFKHEFISILLKNFLKSVIFRRRLTGITPIISFFHGTFRGLITPIDRKTGNFYIKDCRNH